MRASTIAEREARGRAAREHSKRSSHRTVGELHRNPIELLKQSSEGRVEKLVPLRYGRMSVSPFTFFRGTAIIQAHDLSRVPDTGLSMPICGDGHLMNFGGFATPERQLVFDLNDFDEVAMGPFEWDLKRLTASLVVAARHMRLSRGTAEHLVMTAATDYRDRMAQYAQCGALELWYDRITFDLMAETALTPERRRVVRRGMEKAAGRTHESLLEKMAEFDGNRWSIRDAPPGLFHVHGVNTLFSADDDWFTTANWSKLIERTWSEYLKTLSHDRRELLSHFTAQDLVFKVVGVGSVGRQAYVVLCEGNGPGDPLVLQVKEAQASVLEPHLGPSGLRSAGERVVVGQRRMQAGSDLFLGWTQVPGMGSFYVRQLRDMKGGLDVEKMERCVFLDYAQACGTTLARAHARTGDAAAIAGYLGSGPHFEHAVAEFACTYADQVEEDAARFVESRRLH